MAKKKANKEKVEKRSKTRFIKGPYSHRTLTEITTDGDTIFPTPTPPPPHEEEESES